MLRNRRLLSSVPMLSMKNSLIAYWAMDETSGTRNDSHGTNHLTDNNTVGYAAGIKSNAADFVAANANEYLSCEDNASLSMNGTDFAISLWVKFDVFATIGNWLISKRSETNNSEFQVYYSTSNALLRLFLFNNGSTSTTTSVGLSVTTGILYHVVCQFDNSTKVASIVVNDDRENSLACPGYVIADSTSNLHIGRGWSGTITASLAHDGLIDEVSIWKRCLSRYEISWLYNQGYGRSYSEF